MAKKTMPAPQRAGTVTKKNAERMRRILAALAPNPAVLDAWIASGERAVSRRRKSKS